jgi:hypothetical protein
MVPVVAHTAVAATLDMVLVHNTANLVMRPLRWWPELVHTGGACTTEAAITSVETNCHGGRQRYDKIGTPCLRK